MVSNYAVTTNGMPFAVAMEKGYFKEFKVNVDGILTSDGGGTTIRNLLGGKLSYGEAAVSAVVSAVQGGADLKIISGNVHTVAEFVWVAMPKSPVNSLKDLKGRKLGFTNPRSTSQALAHLLMENQGLKQNEVELVRTGGFGAGLTHARDRRRRRGAGGRAAVVEEPGQVQADRVRARHPAGAVQRGGRHHRRGGEGERRLHPRRDPRAAQGGGIHVFQHQGSRRRSSPRPTTSSPRSPSSR